MRLRIETKPPLPALKTWLSASPGLFGLGTRTINDLRKRLVHDFGLPKEIQLQLNGFDLYGKDSIEEVLEKDDLVIVFLRRKEEDEVAVSTVVKKIALGKRKREEEEEEEEEEGEASSEEESADSSTSDSDGESESEEESEDEVEPVDVRMKEPEEDESDTSSDDESSSSASASPPAPAPAPAPTSASSDSDSDSEEQESADESDSEGSESDSSESSTDSDSSDSSNSSTSSSNSSSSTSSSDDSTTLERPTAGPPKLTTWKPTVPPGQGSERTHVRNHRKSRVTTLKRLIAEGTLQKGSTLADLTVHEQGGTSNYFSVPQHDVSSPADFVQEEEYEETGESPADFEVEEEEPMAEVKVEEGKELRGRAPPKRVDVAAVSRFIKAGLVGNERVDREREEARLRGKEKKIVPSEFEVVRERPLLPRKIGAKKQKTTDTDIRQLEMTESETNEVDDNIEETDFVAGFYEQIELAAQARQSRSGKPSTTPMEHINGNPKPMAKKGVPANVVVRAFECEPEWCGMVQAEEGEQVDSIEIDPPSLPFTDNYSRSKKSQPKTKPPPTPPTLAADATKTQLPLSEAEILALPKLDAPSVGAEIFFKSLFLHPQRHEPSILWRWGKITGMEAESMRIEILGPVYKPDEGDEDEEMVEEGEIEIVEEILSWPELRDVRVLIAE